MRKVNFKRVLDALSVSSSLGNTNNTGANSNSVSPNQGKNENEILESLTPENFQVCKIVRHGFPHTPTALAYDPIQRLLAIGTRSGTIRIFGQPGVDIFMSHEGDYAVTQLLFLVNEGGLISVCANNSIHLWNLRQKRPAILHSLEFSKERITFCHLPYTSKWLYIGTERGNIHMCSVEAFQLSGYTINWNKAINLSQTSHPKHIVGLCENPWDESKILFGFESGLIVLWDLKTKEPEHRYNTHSALRHMTWHQDGKQFMCSHLDGSITVWNHKSDAKPQQTQYPHGSEKKTTFRPIDKVEWNTVRNSDAFVIFSGGLPVANLPPRPSVTVMRGKSVTVLEMDYAVVDFFTVCQSPWQCDFQDPTSLVILLENDLVVVDLTSIGYPCLEVPHTIDIHDSPVTTLHCVKDCNSDLTPGLYQVSGNKPRRANCSKMAWPLDGGEWSVDHCTGFPEIIVTGHADGSIRFWDASAVSLKALYKLRTYKLFKRPNNRAQSESQEVNVPVDDDPFAISNICVCAESRSMVACNVSGTIIACVFDKLETNTEIKTLDVNPLPDIIEGIESPVIGDQPSVITEGKLSRQASDSQTTVNNNCVHQNLAKSISQEGTNLSDNNEDVFHQYLPLLRARGGSVKQGPGFKAELIVQFTGNDCEPAPNITYVNVNSAHGLIVIGTTKSITIVDSIQCCVLMNMTSCDLLSSLDHKKCIRSPNRAKAPSFPDFSQINSYSNETGLKSPTTDAPNGNSHSVVHREASSSSTSSNLTKASKRPPHRLYKKTSSCNNNDRSLDSQNSIATDDGEFSHASSISDSDRIDSRDIISSLTFANTYASKGDTITKHCLLVGTTTGYLFNIVINLPNGDQRSTQPVMASPSGNICQLNGSIINCSFLDSVGNLIEQERGYWNDKKKTGTRQDTCDSPSNESADKQYMIITSEKQIKVYVLPSYTQHATFYLPNENTYMTCAGVATVQASSCLLAFTSAGNITIFSLPSLTPLHDVTYLPPLDVRVTQTLCVSDEAQVFYMPSPTEIQRLSCSVELLENVQDIVGNLFIPCTSPIRPNPGFFKGLFGGAPQLDREELFGEASGKPSRSLAKHVPGSGVNLEGLRGASHGVASEMQRVKLVALERGEKLGELEEKTQRMHESASKFAGEAHRLAEKYKNKKWYQL